MESGIGLYLTGRTDCRAGDVLVSVPLSLCISGADVRDQPLSSHLDPGDSYGRAAIALLMLVDAHHRGMQPADVRAAYFLAVASMDHFAATLMAAWPDGIAIAQRLDNSVCWQRSRVEREAIAREHEALVAAGLDVSLERYAWATMVMKTRAHARTDTGHVLMPIIDLANHASVGPTAKVVVTSEAVNLVAAYALSPGDEVTISYDVDADYLDLVERYGFFDAKSVIWTAEIVVPPEVLQCTDEQTRALVAALAADGSDDEHHAWWVPDTRPEHCPIFAALRAKLTAHDERVGSTEDLLVALRDGTIRAEAEARAQFGALVSSHLKEYSTSLEDDQAALERLSRHPAVEAAASADVTSSQERLALRVLIFEKQLLETVARSIRDASGGMSVAA